MSEFNPPEPPDPAEASKAGMTKLMMELYCRDVHGSENGLCPECLRAYEETLERLDRCPYNDGHPCPVCPTCCFVGPDFEAMMDRILHAQKAMDARADDRDQ